MAGGSGCGAPKGHPPYNINGEGGAPKKYTDEFIEAEADAIEEWMKKKDSIWFERLAFERGYDSNLISLWSTQNKRFSVTYQRLKEWQKITLAERGLCKKYNFNMVQLLLGHHYGIFPKQQTTISGDASHPLDVILNHSSGTSKDLISDA